MKKDNSVDVRVEDGTIQGNGRTHRATWLRRDILAVLLIAFENCEQVCIVDLCFL